jgi:Flp pilus assembly protein TadB
MKRRLVARDRLAWLLAVLAAAAVLYLVLPLWALFAAVVIAVGVPLLIRRNRRQRRRRVGRAGR